MALSIISIDVPLRYNSSAVYIFLFYFIVVMLLSLLLEVKVELIGMLVKGMISM